MLVFESIYTEGLAQISYLVGDSKAAVAAVIDPRRDVEVYLDLARDKGLRIAYAIETHIHADFVSGAQALAERCGAEIIGGLRLRAASGGTRQLMLSPSTFGGLKPVIQVWHVERFTAWTRRCGAYQKATLHRRRDPRRFRPLSSRGEGWGEGRGAPEEPTT